MNTTKSISFFLFCIDAFILYILVGIKKSKDNINYNYVWHHLIYFLVLCKKYFFFFFFENIPLKTLFYNEYVLNKWCFWYNYLYIIVILLFFEMTIDRQPSQMNAIQQIRLLILVNNTNISLSQLFVPPCSQRTVPLYLCVFHYHHVWVVCSGFWVPLFTYS